jgi:hypothetical protein
MYKYNEGFFDFSPYCGLKNNADITYGNLGEFLPAAVEAAHKCGIEIYAVYKPFDHAINLTFPFNSNAALKYGKIATLSGESGWAVNGLVKLQDKRIKRRMDEVPAGIEERVVSKIKLYADSSKPTRITRDNLTILVSDDNGAYRKYTEDFDFTDKLEKGKRVITLDKLSIGNRFFSICTPFKDDNGTFKNTLDKLAEIYDTNGESIPFTYGMISRKDRNGVFSLKTSPEITLEGYEFDVFNRKIVTMHGDSLECIIDNSAGYIAFVKGKEEYLTGALSPVYEEVHAYWLRHIEECLEAGVDGVDLRIANHNRTLEWDRYGFEGPVIEEYKRIHGVDITKEAFDRKKQLDIIAGCYTDFYRKASRLIRDAGKKVQLHIGTPALGRGKHPYMGLYWEWEKWIEEGLADEITLKGVWPDDKEYTDMGYKLSSKHNMPIYACPYLNDLTRVSSKDKFENSLRNGLAASVAERKQNGFILYEAASVIRTEKDGKIEILFPGLPQIMKEFKSKESICS